MYNLFLDDIQQPQSAANYMPPHQRDQYRLEEWVVVRNYDEFRDYIVEHGRPNKVSFDHDLAQIHYDPATWSEGFAYDVETGYDCAKWMLWFFNENEWDLPEIHCHFMNPVGKQNILNLFR